MMPDRDATHAAAAVDNDTPAGPRPLWRNRAYMLLWGGQLVSDLGSGISGLAAPLLILALTNSPALAGVAGTVGAIAYLVFALPAGALIDRWDRKRVMMLCDAGRALSLVTIPIAAAIGRLTVWQLYATTAIESSLYVFFSIAQVAALPRVVGRRQRAEHGGQHRRDDPRAVRGRLPLPGRWADGPLPRRRRVVRRFRALARPHPRAVPGAAGSAAAPPPR